MIRCCSFDGSVVYTARTTTANITPLCWYNTAQREIIKKRNNENDDDDGDNKQTNATIMMTKDDDA